MDLEDSSQKLKKKPMKIEDMTKEQLRHAIIKKKECNAKAQHIVECLLEKGIIEDYFLQCLPDINQAHFDDIIEERSIIHLCGYPICEKNLSVKDIPTQKYRISVKTNKVYDITARKSFCSNSCYNAAMYVKKQMLTSPLWFREYETIPTFNLLPLQAQGSMGQEIDVSLVDRVKIKTDQNVFTSISDFAKASINEIQDGDNKDFSFTSFEEAATEENKSHKELEGKSVTESICKDNDKKLKEIDKISYTEMTQNVISETNTSMQHNESPETPVKVISDNSLNKIPKALKDEISQTRDKLEKLSVQEKKPVPNPTNIVGEVVEKAEKKIDPILIGKIEKPQERKPKKVVQKKQPAVTALTIEVEKCLAEWFTLDTMLLLFGDEKVIEMVADKGECIKVYLNNYAKGIFYSANSYDQYQQLCKKLNMLEIEDRRQDSQTLQREMKPLPDYSIIQEESKQMHLKVKAFLSGQTEVVEEKSVPDQTQSVTNDDNVTHIPLVDKNTQNALRRRIVCQHLNKVLPDLLRSLGLLALTISSDVRLLVNTFKLQADNIMFKPIQWTLIAIVFIKLLSIREKRLEYLLEQPMAFQHMQLLLLSYKQDGGYLNRLISWLTDIDRLLDTNDTQLTLE